MEQLRTQFLEHLAPADPRTHEELSAAFKQIATDLSQQYVLSYYPSGEVRDGRFRLFNLNVKTRPGLRVRTRKGYYAPKG